jgi:DNA-directed RNA polymerase subunit RPC12/RpoP
MTAITDFNVTTANGEQVQADAHGNNVAFKCLDCGGPVLAVMMKHQRGESESSPTACKSCGAKYWIEVDAPQSRLVVHRVPVKNAGRFCLGREPNLTAGRNLASWTVISAILQAYGGADYEDLAIAVRQHDHPAGGRSFVDYCIRNGWLKRA